MISTVISFVGYLIILSADLPLAAAAILVVSFPSAIVNFIYRRKNWAYMRFRSRDRREMNYYSDVLVNKDLVKEIRLYDLSGAFIDAYQSVFKRYFSGLRRLIIHEGVWHVSISIVSSVVYFSSSQMMPPSGKNLSPSWTSTYVNRSEPSAI